MKKFILLSLIIGLGTFSSTFANSKSLKRSVSKTSIVKKSTGKKVKIKAKVFDYCCQATVTVTDSEGHSGRATAQFCSVTSMSNACGLATFAATLIAVEHME
jgi:hypothetical protein